MSWKPLGASEGHLGGVLRRLRGVLGRFEASNKLPGWGGEGGIDMLTVLAVLGGSLESSKRIFCLESRILKDSS